MRAVSTATAATMGVGIHVWQVMGDDGQWVMVVVVAVQVYNHSFNFNTVFIMIRGNKQHTYRLRGTIVRVSMVEDRVHKIHAHRVRLRTLSCHCCVLCENPSGSSLNIVI